jgi:hypothetical protein
MDRPLVTDFLANSEGHYGRANDCALVWFLRKQDEVMS